MTPVDQIRTGFGRGQCTEACVASILGVPLDAVPDLWAGPDVPADAPADAHQPMERRQALWWWLREQHGVAWVDLHHAESSATDVEDFFPAVLSALGLPVGDDDEIPPWAEYHLVAGKNPDGVGHFVVGRYGRVVHDPNPTKRGLASRDGIVLLVPLALVPSEWPEPASSWSVRLEAA